MSSPSAAPAPQARWSTADHTPDLLDEWITEQVRMDRMLAPYGKRLLMAAGINSGERVIDIGCGTGAVTAEAAARAMPGGAVLGVDISARMLAAARRRTAGCPGVSLVLDDAQTHPFRIGAHDVVISRFGMGHFVDLVAALRNIGAALRPGGRLTFLEWGHPTANEWMTLADRVGAAALDGRWPTRPDRSDHDPTGTVEARLHQALELAGLDVESVDIVAEPMWAGDTVPDVLAWFQTLPDSRPLHALPDTDWETYLAALGAELSSRRGPAGVLLGGSAWLVTARRPVERVMATVTADRAPR
jgi:SAM-dependent methyltransferase